MPRKQKQRQKQSQRQVVNINLGKSSTKPKRKYTRRTQTRVVQQQPIYNFTPQPYQLTPQVFMTPQPRQELEIPSLAQQQPKKNTVGEIKMNIPEPPKPELKQYTEPPLSEYTKPAPKPPSNIISERPKLSGLQEALEAQRERMLKVKQDPLPVSRADEKLIEYMNLSFPQSGYFPPEPETPITLPRPKRRPPQKIIGERRKSGKANERLQMGIEDVRGGVLREDVFGRQIAERKPFISPISIASPIKRGRPSKGKGLPQYKERELMTMEDR